LYGKGPFIADIFLLLLTDNSDRLKQHDEFLLFLSSCDAIFERYLPKEGRKEGREEERKRGLVIRQIYKITI
jgi:hypothetical protein